MKERLAEHGGNWEITQILVRGKELSYHYKYIGYHPDPYFKRKIDKELDLSAKAMAALIKELKDNNLLKPLVDIRTHTSLDESFNINLMIKLKEREVHTKLSGLVSDFKQKGNPASYRHYKNIVSFVDFIRNMVLTSQQ